MNLTINKLIREGDGKRRRNAVSDKLEKRKISNNHFGVFEKT